MTHHTSVAIWFIKIFLNTVLPCILSISSWSLQHLLGLYHFLSYIVSIFGQNAPLMFPIFLKRSLVFPLLLLYSIIKHCSLKVFLSYLATFWNSAFNWMHLSLSPLLFASLCSSASHKASLDNHFALLLFFFFGMVLFACMAWFITSLSYASPFATSRQWSMKGIPNILIFSNEFGVGLFLALVLETQRVFSS